MYVYRKAQSAIKENSVSKLFWKLWHKRLSAKYGIHMPLHVTIGQGFGLYHINGVVIGPNAVFGDNCSVLQQVTVGNSKKSRTIIAHMGNGVQLCAGAKIIGPVTIHDNVTIGANAVVTKDCPPNTTWGGVPAHQISQGIPNLINIDYLSYEQWKNS